MPVPSSSSRRSEASRRKRTQQKIEALAQFRHALRRFLRFSENAARACGITPQQHQLMLGVAGFTGRGDASISELADFLQEKHHSVIGLIDRAVQNGLVQRRDDPEDRRVVLVSLTARGEEVLLELTRIHEAQAHAMAAVSAALAERL